MIPVVDRVPTYPNRIKLTYSNGDTEYVTWERADEPTVEGTPLNKALFDSIAADIGLAGGDLDLYVSGAGSDTLNDGSESLPFATIGKALSKIPSNLNGCDATIHIVAGTYDEVVAINGYYGGRIVLAGKSSSSAVSVRGIALEDSNCVSIESSIILTVGASGIVVGNNSCMDIAGNINVNGAAYGVHANGHAQFFCAGTLTVSNATTAAVQATGGWVQLTTLAGSDNAVGVIAQRGGLVAYTTNTLSATTATQTAGGGRVFAGAQSGWIATNDLASNSVTAAKIASGAITKAKLADPYATPSVAAEATLSGWVDNVCAVTVSGVTADSHVIVTPHPDSFVMWADCMVRATDQGTDSLTFVCEDVPGENVKANILIVG